MSSIAPGSNSFIFLLQSRFLSNLTMLWPSSGRLLNIHNVNYKWKIKKMYMTLLYGHNIVIVDRKYDWSKYSEGLDHKVSTDKIWSVENGYRWIYSNHNMSRFFVWSYLCWYWNHDWIMSSVSGCIQSWCVAMNSQKTFVLISFCCTFQEFMATHQLFMHPKTLEIYI